MITTKKINIGISFISRTLRVAIVLYFAVLLANVVWWTLNPTHSDHYIEKFDLDQSDKFSNYITNRYPMGIITAPKEVAKPRIVDQIKLTGVYASDPQHSIAFLEYSGKPMIVRLGGSINGQANVKLINPTSIVIIEDGVEATISIISGSGSGGGSASNSTNSGMPSIFGSQGNPPSQPYYSQPSVNEQNSSDDYREKRRRMMEEMMQKEKGNYPPSDGGGPGYGPGSSNSTYPPGAYPPGYPPENMNR